MNDHGTPVSINPELTKAKELIEDAKFEQAAQFLIGFLRRHRDHPQALALLGETANCLGALGQAEQFLLKAIKLGSRDYDTRRQLAAVVNQQERPAIAIPMFENLASERGDTGLRAILANTLEKIGKADEARAIYRQLLDEKPTSAQLWIAYGHNLRAGGQVEDAVAAFRKAIAIDDGTGDAWWGLASIKKPILNDNDIAVMRAALAIAIDERNEAPLNFSLARALHDKGEFEDAFHHYEEGNRLRAKAIGYDARELSAEVDEIRDKVGMTYMSGLPTESVGDDIPVFVVSLPRSGSTLLEQILGSHSQIEPVGELPYIPAILRGFMEIATRRGKTTVPQAIEGLSGEQAARFGQEYLERASVHRTQNTRFFIDKLPHNWSNILFIRKILPQSRFIDIRRPAMDCCFSNFTQSFSSAHAASFSLEDVGRCYVDNVRLLSHFDDVAPDMVHHVDYSMLVEDPRQQIGKVLTYLGLDWEEGVLDFHQLDRVVRTPSSEQVRRPLNRDGMAIWKPYSNWLGPLREALGDLAEQ